MSVLILVVDDEEDVPASSQRYGLGVRPHFLSLLTMTATWRRHANLVSAPFPTALITLLLAVGLATSALSAQLVVSLEGWPREDANGCASAKLAKQGYSAACCQRSGQRYNQLERTHAVPDDV